MRGIVKRLVLVTLVIAGFVFFDCAMDYMARHAFPSLFGLIFYPIDIAGAIEYTVGFAVLYVSNKKSVDWLSAGTIACLAYSVVLIAQKLVLH